MIRSREQGHGAQSAQSAAASSFGDYWSTLAMLKLCTRSGIYVTVQIDSMCSRTEYSYKGRAAEALSQYLSGTKKAMREVDTNSVPGPLP